MDPVVILGTDSIAVGPGEQARLPVRVRNQSRRVESYRIDVVGAAAAFARVEPATVSVLPGREAEVSVMFTPPGGATAPSGSVPFAVRATSEVEATYSAAAEGTLELAGVAGLQMWAANNAAAGRWSGNYLLEFANQGNAGARLAVTGRDPSAALRVTVEQELVDLRPGARSSTRVKAKARHPFLRGSPVNRMIQVDCRNVPFGVLPPAPGAAPDPTDPDHRTLQLTFQQKPVLSKLALAGIVVAAALLLAFVVVRLRQTDELTLDLVAPEAPAGFSVEPASSTSVFLRWQPVPNAVGYRIRNTTSSGEMGSEVEALDAAALSHTVTELEPGQEVCFALVAIGPEGASDSAPSDHRCATTTPPSRLAAPEGLIVSPEGGGRFALQWTYPDTPGVSFAVLVDNTRRPDLVIGSSTSITLAQEERAYDVPIAVQAVLADQSSDPTPAQTVTVEALPVTATTPVPTAATTPAAVTTVVPPPPPPPPSGGAATTTTTGATSTTIVAPAAPILQDLPATPAAFLGRYRPESEGGVPLEERKNALALTFNVPITDIAVFTNRDTRIRDSVGTGGDLANLPPETQFFYVSRATVQEADAVCDQNPARECGTFTLQGAPSASAGTTVVVIDRLPATTSIQDLDETLERRRDELGRQSVFALDGGSFRNLPASEVLLFVSDLATPQEVDQFCADHPAVSCLRSELVPLP